MIRKSRLHVIISGKVQGVWYRASAKDIAQTLSLAGWIRNNTDGTVESLLEGDRENLEKFLSWCYDGPDLAEVRTIEVKWGKYTGEFKEIIISH